MILIVFYKLGEKEGQKKLVEEVQTAFAGLQKNSSRRS
jgi:hypothetical protein